MHVRTQFTKPRHPELSSAESPAQKHHEAPLVHSMQPSQPGLPVFGFAGSLPPCATGQIGFVVGVVGQPASGTDQQTLFVVG